MAKEKLFTPEDFDKEPKLPKKNTTKWIIGSIIVICVIVAIIFGTKGCNSYNKSNKSVEAVSTAEVVNSSSVDSTNIEETAVVNENVNQQSEVQTLQESEVNSQKPRETLESTIVQPNSGVSSEIESEAFKVIRGDYGNYPERKNALGEKYESIQNHVNQLKRQGVF